MPVYNEVATLADALGRVLLVLEALPQARYRYELIVVDDGSSDSTGGVASAIAARSYATRVVTHERNLGLAAALVTGVGAARGEAVVVLDADLSYAPEIVPLLLGALFDRRAAVVLASPYMRGGSTANVPWDRLLASRAANALLSVLVGGRIKTFTGMVRAYDARFLRSVVAEPIAGEFNAGVLATILRRGGKIVELPAALHWPPHRANAPSRMSPAALLRRIRLVVASAAELFAASRDLGSL